MTINNLPDIMHPRDIANYLGISYSKALELVKCGELPTIQIRNVYKIPKQGFIDWLCKPGLRKVLD